MRLRVTGIVEETPSTKTFHFERLDGSLPPFTPGQYVNLFVDVDGILTSQSYSVSSPPETDRMALTVRDKVGGFVAPFLLNELQAGDELESSGPSGSFYHEPLMNSLERYGIVVPAVCRTGACIACRIRLLSGNIYMPSRTGLSESDRQHGFIHACVSYPLTDLQIRL